MNAQKDIEIIDWYDGPISGVVKFQDSDKWYLFHLAAWNFHSNLKVFILLDMNNTQAEDCLYYVKNVDYRKVKEKMKSFFLSYKESVHLLRAIDIESNQNDIIRVPPGTMKYFEDIEEVVNQSEEENKMWFQYFDN